MVYVVVIPLVITKKPDGSDLYLYEGGVLPATAKPEEVRRLLEEKFIAELPDPEPDPEPLPKRAAAKAAE